MKNRMLIIIQTLSMDRYATGHWSLIDNWPLPERPVNNQVKDRIQMLFSGLQRSLSHSLTQNIDVIVNSLSSIDYFTIHDMIVKSNSHLP